LSAFLHLARASEARQKWLILGLALVFTSAAWKTSHVPIIWISALRARPQTRKFRRPRIGEEEEFAQTQLREFAASSLNA
jgi:hypothetical protein